MNISLKSRLLAAALLALVCTAVPAPPARALDEAALLAAPTPPEIPTGYTEQGHLMLAVAAGQLTLLDINAPIAVPENVELLSGLQYSTQGDPRQVLDLYLPKGNDKPLPLLVFIHGGGWTSGKTTDYKYYCVRYAQRGYVVASITYRFADKFPYPACVQDAKCAVRFLRANADKYHIDKARVAAIGGSAGGHLSMMLGYSSGVKELEGDGGYADQSSAVQVVVDLYGPTDMTVPAVRKNSTLMRFFAGKSYDEAPDLYAQASPITHVTKDSPPTLILQGTIDDIVPMEQSDLLYAKLKELGVPVQYEKFDGFPHTMDITLEANVRCQWFINRFLDKYLTAKK
jgi:acetyl esterase/lipase